VVIAVIVIAVINVRVRIVRTAQLPTIEEIATKPLVIGRVYDLEPAAASVLIVEGLAILEMRAGDRRAYSPQARAPAYPDDRRRRERRRTGLRSTIT
jgi:hypothetical protein